MPVIPMNELPDDAKLWIFPATEPVAEEDRGRLAREVDAFLDSWAAHGTPVPASWKIVDDRFVVIAADESASPSGCSIDALFRFMRNVGEETGTDFLDSTSLYYRDREGHPVRTDRVAFQRLSEAGEVSGDTEVYDTTCERLGDFRHAFLKKAAESWHAQLLAPAAAS